MSAIQERYQPVSIGVNGTARIGTFLGGFLALTTGTLTVTANGATLINAVPVTAGSYLPMPFITGDPASTVTLAGGASGVVAAG